MESDMEFNYQIFKIFNWS